MGEFLSEISGSKLLHNLQSWPYIYVKSRYFVDEINGQLLTASKWTSYNIASKAKVYTQISYISILKITIPQYFW